MRRFRLGPMIKDNDYSAILRSFSRRIINLSVHSRSADAGRDAATERTNRIKSLAPFPAASAPHRGLTASPQIGIYTSPAATIMPGSCQQGPHAPIV